MGASSEIQKEKPPINRRATVMTQPLLGMTGIFQGKSKIRLFFWRT
jgi:hypothetical protein